MKSINSTPCDLVNMYCYFIILLWWWIVVYKLYLDSLTKNKLFRYNWTLKACRSCTTHVLNHKKKHSETNRLNKSSNWALYNEASSTSKISLGYLVWPSTQNINLGFRNLVLSVFTRGVCSIDRHGYLCWTPNLLLMFKIKIKRYIWIKAPPTDYSKFGLWIFR